MSDVQNPVPPPELALSLPKWVTPLFAFIVAIVAAYLVRKAWAIPAFAVWGAHLGAITAIDLKELRVPNVLVASASAVMFPLLALASLADIAGSSFWRAVLGALAGFGVYLVMNLVAPRSLGMGDVKLSFVIGAHLAFIGWNTWFWAIFLAFAGMAVVGLMLMAAQRAGFKTALPFGPFMVLGALVALALVS